MFCGGEAGFADGQHIHAVNFCAGNVEAGAAFIEVGFRG